MRHSLRVWVGFGAISLALATAAGAEQASALAGEVTTYTTVRGDTWRSVGSRFGVYPSTLAAENQLNTKQQLNTGQQLRIDNRHIVPAGVEPGSITINVAQRLLFFRDGNGFSAFPVAVGKSDWQTPPAPFTVETKEKNPTWHVPDSILAESARAGRTQAPVVPPGPKNPLGQFWIGLSIPGFGIHGTPYPSSIYQAATHGCIRLQRDDIENLFDRVEVGMRGRIIYEPILLTVSGDDVYIEVHEDVYRRLADTPARTARGLATALGLTERIDWASADRELAARSGVARVVTRREPPASASK